MNPRAEQLAAATLAKMMSGELNAVDQMTIDNNDPNKRANRINMDSFIAPLLNKPSQPHNPSFAYVPEELVQSMVPDTAIGSRPAAPDLIPLPSGYKLAPQIPNIIPIPNHTDPPKSQPLVLGPGIDEVTKGNIASIANNLVLLRKDFAKVLGPLLNYLKQMEPSKKVDIFPLTGITTLIDNEVDTVRTQVAEEKSPSNKKKEN